MRWQYSPKDGLHKTMACLVNVAKYLRTSALATDGKPVEPLPEPWILKAIRLDPETVADRVAEVRTGIDAANQLVAGE